jgi:hypothetical protein
VYSELEFANIIYRRRIPFEFNTPSKVKGEDYDLRIKLFDNKFVFCEVKCKIEGTKLTRTSIRNSFIASRKQLPNSGPGIIGIKFPENWILDDRSGPFLKSVLDDCFQHTSRVVAVVIRWEEFIPLPIGGGTAVYKFTVINNAIYQINDEAVSKLLEILPQPIDNNWIRFRNIYNEIMQTPNPRIEPT